MHLKVLRAKTPFSGFLASSLHLCRPGKPPPANVLFLLPAGWGGSFKTAGTRGTLEAGLEPLVSPSAGTEDSAGSETTSHLSDACAKVEVAMRSPSRAVWTFRDCLVQVPVAHTTGNP